MGLNQATTNAEMPVANSVETPTVPTADTTVTPMTFNDMPTPGMDVNPVSAPVPDAQAVEPIQSVEPVQAPVLPSFPVRSALPSPTHTVPSGPGRC